MRPLIVDVDDLLVEDQITEHLVPIRNVIEDFKVTAYSVPNRLGPVSALKRIYPWIQFGIHGFEHTFCECLTWSVTEAKGLIEEALKMDYDPIFKAPNWEGSEEVEEACRQLGVLYHHHESKLPKTEGLMVYPGPPHRHRGMDKYSPLHTHILKNMYTDYIETHPGFQIANLKGNEFLLPQERSVIV